MDGITHGNRQKYESQNPVQRALIARFQSSVLHHVRDIAPNDLLDIGCGEGYMLDVLARAGAGGRMTGIDLSQEAIALASARLGSDVRLEVADARALAADARRFDVVMMLEVLEHIPHPATMLPIVAALTRRYALLSVPWEPHFCALNFLRGKNLRRWGNDPEHVNHWTRHGFRRFVAPYFHIVAAPFVYPWTLLVLEKRVH